MIFNHRFLLRLITNLVICTLALSCVSVLLWTIDEFVGWDILPDTLGIYVRALVIGIAWITGTLIAMHLLLSLTLFAEASATRAKLTDFKVSPLLKRRLKRLLILTVLASILLLFGLQVVDGARKKVAEQVAKQEAIIKFNQIHEDIEQALPEILKQFTPSLLSSIQSNTISASEIRQILQAVTVSFPHNPSLVLLIPAEAPYKYYRIDQQAIPTDKNGVPYLKPQFYFEFPTQLESEIVDKLFSGQTSSTKTALNGVFIRNTLPSSWGILRLDGQVIALVYLGVNYRCPQPTQLIKDSCIHSGPKALYTN